MTLPQAIRAIRVREGMSQEQFGAEFERTQAWCSYVESGSRAVSVVDLQRMSVRYGLKLERGYWHVQNGAAT